MRKPAAAATKSVHPAKLAGGKKVFDCYAVKRTYLGRYNSRERAGEAFDHWMKTGERLASDSNRPSLPALTRRTNVNKDAKSGSWCARGYYLEKDGSRVNHFIGSFDTEVEANTAADAWRASKEPVTTGRRKTVGRKRKGEYGPDNPRPTRTAIYALPPEQRPAPVAYPDPRAQRPDESRVDWMKRIARATA